MSLLDNATNDFGKLGPEIRARLLAFIAAPSVELWDDIASIIVGGFSRCGHKPSCRTVWQAVIAVDPSFPRACNPEPSGRRLPAAKRWPRFPDAVTVARAIKHATTKTES